MKRVLPALLIVLLLSSACLAWWDTSNVINRPVPLVKEIEAEACAGFPADALKDDPQSNGGRGGKAVLLTPGGPGISADFEVPTGLYAIFTIARSPEGKIGNDLMTLEVKEHATGIGDWPGDKKPTEQYDKDAENESFFNFIGENIY